MNSNRKAAAVAGWLYVLGFVTGILSVAYAVDAPDYLLKAAAIPGAGQTGSISSLNRRRGQIPGLIFRFLSGVTSNNIRRIALFPSILLK